jgi:hypothetical protein
MAEDRCKESGGSSDLVSMAREENTLLRVYWAVAVGFVKGNGRVDSRTGGSSLICESM